LHAVLGGLFIGAITIFAFWYGFYEHGYNPFTDQVPVEIIQYARTMAFMVLIAGQLFFALSVRNSKKSIFRIGIFTNKYLIGAIVTGLLLQLIVIAIPSMQKAFKLQMLDLKGWLMAIGLGLAPLLFNEVYKIFIRRGSKNPIRENPV